MRRLGTRRGKPGDPPRHAPIPTPMAGLSDSVAQTPRSGSVCAAADGPRGLERATKGAKLYLCVAVPAAGGLSRPEAGARLLGEFSGGGIRGEPQWLADSSRLVLTRTRPTLWSLRRPGAPPRPLRLGTLRDQYLSRSEIRGPPTPHIRAFEEERVGRRREGE